jgi:hypothetical protein
VLADGVDPSSKRRAERSPRGNTIEIIAREWLSLQKKRLKASTLTRETNQPEAFIFPGPGSRPVTQITPLEILAALRRIEARGTHDTAHRTRSSCSRVYRFAVATGRAERDATADLKGALAPVVKRSFAATTEPGRIGELLRAIDRYVGQATTHAALKLAPLSFCAPWGTQSRRVGGVYA